MVQACNPRALEAKTGGIASSGLALVTYKKLPEKTNKQKPNIKYNPAEGYRSVTKAMISKERGPGFNPQHTIKRNAVLSRNCWCNLLEKMFLCYPFPSKSLEHGERFVLYAKPWWEGEVEVLRLCPACLGWWPLSTCCYLPCRRLWLLLCKCDLGSLAGFGQNPATGPWLTQPLSCLPWAGDIRSLAGFWCSPATVASDNSCLRGLLLSYPLMFCFVLRTRKKAKFIER